MASRPPPLPSAWDNSRPQFERYDPSLLPKQPEELFDPHQVHRNLSDELLHFCYHATNTHFDYGQDDDDVQDAVGKFKILLELGANPNSRRFASLKDVRKREREELQLHGLAGAGEGEEKTPGQTSEFLERVLEFEGLDDNSAAAGPLGQQSAHRTEIFRQHGRARGKRPIDFGRHPDEREAASYLPSIAIGGRREIAIPPYLKMPVGAQGFLAGRDKGVRGDGVIDTKHPRLSTACDRSHLLSKVGHTFSSKAICVPSSRIFPWTIPRARRISDASLAYRSDVSRAYLMSQCVMQVLCREVCRRWICCRRSAIRFSSKSSPHYL